MLKTHSHNKHRSRLGWSIGAAVILFAGLAAGYLLPFTDHPTVETSAAVSVDAARKAIDKVEVPFDAPSGPVTHEFALTAADVRDTQEAPAVAIDAKGRICLAWASKTADAERSLFVAVSDDGGNTFSGPRLIRRSGVFKSSSPSKAKSGGFERRMVPLFVCHADTILLAWNEAPADGSTIRMMLAESRDGGQSFSEPICAHQSADARPTFNSLAVNDHGQAVCGWLDSRNGAQQPFAAVRPVGARQFGLEQQVYAGPEGAGVCPCCLTAAAVDSDGAVFVAFRNQMDGYRDTWVSRLSAPGAAFSEPMPVTAPTWQFDGCPHDGPNLAISRGQLHVAWMDAHSGRQRAYYARAPLGDLQFTVEPLHVSGPGTQGNAKLCSDGTGRLHAVWEESIAEEPVADNANDKDSHGGHRHGPPTGAGRVIMYSVSPLADGHFGKARAIAPRPMRFQTRPAIACGKGDIVVAWNELDESGKRVVVTKLANVESALASSQPESDK